jgi:hypothetical protein
MPARHRSTLRGAPRDMALTLARSCDVVWRAFRDPAAGRGQPLLHLSRGDRCPYAGPRRPRSRRARDGGRLLSPPVASGHSDGGPRRTLAESDPEAGRAQLDSALHAYERVGDDHDADRMRLAARSRGPPPVPEPCRAARGGLGERHRNRAPGRGARSSGPDEPRGRRRHVSLPPHGRLPRAPGRSQARRALTRRAAD